MIRLAWSVAFVVCCPFVSLAADLPPELRAVKQQILDIASANTTNTDNIAEVRAELEPLIEQLEVWFNANRPENEVPLTQVPWKSIWYDDPDISFDFSTLFFQLSQPRDRIYQVIEDGYYYNVSELEITILGRKQVIQNYLKGVYSILRPADESNVGEPRLNTVDLEFAANAIRRGALTPNIPLSPLVRAVDAGIVPTIPIPGPIGVTGELWNRYVDADLRIAGGFDDSELETIDLYLLRRVARSE